MNQSIHNQIKVAIKKKRRGNIFFANDFKAFGNGDTIRQVLSRLCREEFIFRLSKGIYLYPKINKQVGILYPSIEDVAKAIAKREKARLIPTGAYALNKLGLSTQVPMKVVFLTDGSPRVVKVGKRATLRFIKTTPKYLALKGRITTLVIFALKEIGKGKVRENELQIIKEVLSHESKEIIAHDKALAPEWIANIITNLTKDESLDTIA